MNLNLIGLIFILFYAAGGYFGGALSVLNAFFSFLIASLLAKPLSFLLSGVVANIEAIPLTLKPLAGILITGIILFLIIENIIGYFISSRKKKLKAMELPPVSKAERVGGALLGGMWGLFLVVLVFIGIDIIGNMSESVSLATQSAAQIISNKSLSSYKEPSLQSQNVSVNQSVQQNSQVSSHQPDNQSSPVKQMKPESHVMTSQISQKESFISNIKKEVDNSVFAPIVKKMNPVSEDTTHSMGELMVITSDPAKFEKFREHPVVSKLAKNPKIIELSNDKEIQELVQAGKYNELLNNPKIASLLNDEEIIREFKNVNINQLLKDINQEKGSEK